MKLCTCVQEQKAKNEQASVLAQEGAYSNPPSIIDSMRKTQQDPDKVNPFGNGVLGFGAVLLVAVALIASAIGLGSDPSAPTTSGLVCFLSNPASAWTVEPRNTNMLAPSMHSSMPSEASTVCVSAHLCGSARDSDTVHLALRVNKNNTHPSVHVQPSVAEEASTTIREQLAGFEAKLAADASDAEALEGAAVSYVNLGDYAKAEGVLSKLVTLNSKDPQAWRLLGEVRL